MDSYISILIFYFKINMRILVIVCFVIIVWIVFSVCVVDMSYIIDGLYLVGDIVGYIE